ncbi:hypothetical protein SNEBB_010448 [Seison nebaliae]|nr:hypothetical protein SNEBB_010448 [Seison nebaliae]
MLKSGEISQTNKDGKEHRIMVNQTSYIKPPRTIAPLFHNSTASVLLFSPIWLVVPKEHGIPLVGKKERMTFKFLHAEIRLIKTILVRHGFAEVHANSCNFNLIWTGGPIRPYYLNAFSSYQKINHFPRSHELTRKDSLYRNLQRLQKQKGTKQIDFLPDFFLIPDEYNDFAIACARSKKKFWIVKPVASSCGKGIYIIQRPNELSMEEPVIVSAYLQNPLLIDGFKFDLRIYVAVTSFNPLVIYIYEEGLTRFATVRYDESDLPNNHKQACIHLTNYSVNKKNDSYIRCEYPDVENYGNKWSLSGVLQYLERNKYSTFSLMAKIEDVIIKTILSVEPVISASCKAFMPHSRSCFELYGFDILIDNNLQPWLLEVNLSPSLACDAPLDLKVKSHMICDLFSLIGLMCVNPQKNVNMNSKVKVRAVKPYNKAKHSKTSLGDARSNSGTLSNEELRTIKYIEEEYCRKGGWIRIFPTSDTWEFYSTYFEANKQINAALHRQLYPDRWIQNDPRKAIMTRSKSLNQQFFRIKGQIAISPIKSDSKTSNNLSESKDHIQIINEDEHKEILSLEKNSGSSLSDALYRYSLYIRQMDDRSKLQPKKLDDIESSNISLSLSADHKDSLSKSLNNNANGPYAVGELMQLIMRGFRLPQVYARNTYSKYIRELINHKLDDIQNSDYLSIYSILSQLNNSSVSPINLKRIDMETSPIVQKKVIIKQSKLILDNYDNYTKKISDYEEKCSSNDHQQFNTKSEYAETSNVSLSVLSQPAYLTKKCEFNEGRYRLFLEMSTVDELSHFISYYVSGVPNAKRLFGVHRKSTKHSKTKLTKSSSRSNIDDSSSLKNSIVNGFVGYPSQDNHHSEYTTKKKPTDTMSIQTNFSTKRNHLAATAKVYSQKMAQGSRPSVSRESNSCRLPSIRRQVNRTPQPSARSISLRYKTTEKPTKPATPLPRYKIKRSSSLKSEGDRRSTSISRSNSIYESRSSSRMSIRSTGSCRNKNSDKRPQSISTKRKFLARKTKLKQVNGNSFS